MIPTLDRVLVTGGSGFIGSNLVAALLATPGTSVRSLDITSPQVRAHASVWKQADLLDRDIVKQEVRSFEPTHVVHLAARTDLRGTALSDYAVNVVGTESLIDALTALEHRPRTIFASSRLVANIHTPPEHEFDYSPPNAYGRSKVAGEHIVHYRACGLPWTIVRPTSIWGPYFGVPYRDFFLSVLAGRYVHPSGMHIRKSFGYVGNAVHQIVKLLSAPSVEGRTLYLADYTPIDVHAMANVIRRSAGLSPIRSVPFPVLKLAARLGDAGRSLGWDNAPLTSFRLDNLTTDMLHDHKELKAVVGPLPFGMPAGVVQTLVYLGYIPRNSAGATWPDAD